MKGKRNDIAPLLKREKFISRSMVSASFSLVEAFISGLFFTALSTHALGSLPCDEELLRYVKNKEKGATLKDRIDRIVMFASSGEADGRSDPFRTFIEVGKRYRDAIHHTTPFGRKDLDAGERLVALYKVKSDVAVLCALLSFNSVLTLSQWIYGEEDGNEIADSCKELRDKLVDYSLEHGLLKAGESASEDPLLTPSAKFRCRADLEPDRPQIESYPLDRGQQIADGAVRRHGQEALARTGWQRAAHRL
jgi:hypothetical protein